MDLDFTLTKYEELCKKIIESKYIVLSLREYFSLHNKPNKYIIFRHDIDDEIDLLNSLKMAKIESNLGLITTYYFRTTNRVYKKDIIKQIADMGHEIGYHYETLGKTDGNIDLAFKLFKEELDDFRKFYPIVTIAQHGGPIKGEASAASFSGIFKIVIGLIFEAKTLDFFSSKEIWKKFNFSEFGIFGEAYLSIDYNEVAYFTDTNRSWNDPKNRMKDFVEGNRNAGIFINCTDDLIKIIENGSMDKILILTHPSNWKGNLLEWISWLILQEIRNFGKKMLIIYSRSTKTER